MVSITQETVLCVDAILKPQEAGQPVSYWGNVDFIIETVAKTDNEPPLRYGRNVILQRRIF